MSAPEPAADRESLGALVRQVWVACAREHPDPKPSWLTPWPDLDDFQREVDMRIGAEVAAWGAAAEREKILDFVRQYEAVPPDQRYMSCSTYLATALARVIHLAGEEPCLPACWTSSDAPWETPAWITQNPATVTCPAAECAGRDAADPPPHHHAADFDADTCPLCFPSAGRAPLITDEPEMTITVEAETPGNMPLGRMLQDQADAEREYGDAR